MYILKSYICEVSLLSVNSCDFSFCIVIDKVSLIFGVVVTLISGSVFIFACKYISEDPYFYRFKWILLMFVISINVLIFSGSYLVILFGWDGLGVTSFALIVYYQRKERLLAGFQTLLLNRLGDVIIVISFFYYVLFGQFSFSFAIQECIIILVLFLVLASFTKSAQYPFRSWLPAAMAAPTPVSALVHSSTLVTAGIYLILRLLIIVKFLDYMLNIILFLGAITCFLGGAAALFENDLKKIVALSTLRQLGLIIFTLGIGYPNIALFHLFTHAIFKALLFLAAGSILLSSFGVQDLRILGATAKNLPFCTIIFNISRMCLAGIPFLSAFYSKHIILEKMFFTRINFFSLVFVRLGTICTVFYRIRLLKNLCWANPNIVLMLKESSFLVNFPIIILSCCSVFRGKLLFNIENWFLEVQLINFPNTINLFVLLGVFFGIVFTINIKTYLFSTLFFLTPLYNYSTKIFNPLVLSVYHLDYGWLEPNLKVLNNVSSGVRVFFNWPKVNSGMYIYILLIIILLIGFYF